MLISSGVLVSDCHKAVIYLEGTEYRCGFCSQPCKSAGSIGEVYKGTQPIYTQAQLDTAVAEARQETWKKAIYLANREAFERRMAYCVVEALKAAATEGDE